MMFCQEAWSCYTLDHSHMFHPSPVSTFHSIPLQVAAEQPRRLGAVTQPQPRPQQRIFAVASERFGIPADAVRRFLAAGSADPVMARLLRHSVDIAIDPHGPSMAISGDPRAVKAAAAEALALIYGDKKAAGASDEVRTASIVLRLAQNFCKPAVGQRLFGPPPRRSSTAMSRRENFLSQFRVRCSRISGKRARGGRRADGFERQALLLGELL